MVKRSTSDAAVTLVKSLPSWAKIVLAIGALITTLYGAVRFVADAEYARFEQTQRKIGREEFERRMSKVDDRLRALETREVH